MNLFSSEIEKLVSTLYKHSEMKKQLLSCIECSLIKTAQI